MSAPRMRPRFAMQLTCGKDEAMAAIQKKLAMEPKAVDGKISGPHVVLTLCSEPPRLWSPRLNLTLEESHAGATLWCQFAPYPQVWTGFVATYAVLAFLGLSGSMYGLAQLSIGGSPWGLTVPLVTTLIAVGVYTTSFVGQGLACDEMTRLRHFLEDCFDETVIAGRVFGAPVFFSSLQRPSKEDS